MNSPKRTKRIFWAILLVGLLIRLYLSVYQYSGDIKNHFVWGNGFLENPLGFFTRHFTGFNDPNYPPLAIILFALSNFLQQTVVSLVVSLNSLFSFFPSQLVPFFQSENVRYAFLKLPGIIADIFTFVFIYKILQKQKVKKPLLLSSLYLLNPAIIYISSVWGQIEPLTNFFLVWSLYLVLYSEKKYLSPVVFMLGALVKQTTFWYVPFYLILWLKMIPVKDYIRSILITILTFFVFYLPFGLLPLGAIKTYLATLSGSSTLLGDGAWNLWYFFFPQGTSDSVMVGPVSVRVLSIIILLVSLVLLLYQSTQKYSLGKLLNYLFIWSLLVFFIQTRVHERHLAPALLFCLLTPGLASRYLLDFLFLSVYHMLNLFWSLRLPFI